MFFCYNTLVMYATTSLPSVYHKFRDNPENDGYLLAFGVGSFFEFLKSDAHRINEALPDVKVVNENGCDKVQVHGLGFFPFCARLKAKGLKVAMVERKAAANHKVNYRVVSRSDE